MKLLCPEKPISKFTGKPSFRSTALPVNGKTMIQSKVFPHLLYPASICSRKAIGEAIREGRTL